MIKELNITKKTREEVLAELREDSVTWSVFGQFDVVRQEDFIRFCMGEQGICVTYDAVFKKIFNPQTHPERLEQFISDVLGKKVKIVEILQNQGIVIQEEGSFIIMDVVVQLEDGTLLNVEMQKYGYLFPAQRTDCYLSDLLMRQYSDLKKKKGSSFQFSDMSKVVAIVIMEQSPKEFHSVKDIYIHHGEMAYGTEIKLGDLFESTYICLDMYKKMPHTEIDNKREAWMRFLASQSMKDIVDLCERYPEFIPLYEDVFEFKRNIKELVSVFSEALAVMTKNTERYMVGQLEEALEAKNEEIKQRVEEIKKKDAEIEKKAAEIEERDQVIEKKDERIKELEKLLSEK